MEDEGKHSPSSLLPSNTETERHPTQHLSNGGSDSVIPAKRAADHDTVEEGRVAAEDAGPAEAHQAHRAYIARTAPHLLESNMQSCSSPSYSASDVSSPRPVNELNGGGRGTQSSTPSCRQSSTPENDHERKSSAQEASIYAHAIEPSRQRSHHAVPRRFRGPLPVVGDAEDLAPAPHLVPVLGSGPHSDLYSMLNYPLNRNGWRYIAAGPASHALPQSVYRTLESEPYGIHWSWTDRSSFTLLSQDASIISATNGFRSARANVPVREGSWYAEIHILEPNGPSPSSHDANHVRLGWARREASLNAPVGSNGFSYGMRDATGEKVFLSRTYPYGQAFKPGDVVGMWIRLPPARKADPRDSFDPARIERKRLPIRYKGRLYFEQLEYAVPKEMDYLMERSRKGEKLMGPRGPLRTDTSVSASTGMLAAPASQTGQKKRKGGVPPPGSQASKDPTANFRSLPTLGPDSQIGFFVNGEPQGIAFENLLDYRPLRRPKSGHAKVKSSVKSKATIGLANGDGKDDENDIITASSTAASILKSRENNYDDGATGYFPFVSMFGSARARLVTSASDFRFPPPPCIRHALEQADRDRGRFAAASVAIGEACKIAGEVDWRPLADRYDGFVQELWKYDLADEVRAVAAARKAADESSDEDDNSDEDEGDGSTHRATAKGPARRPKKKKPSASSRRTGSVTPADGSAQPSASGSPQTTMVKEEEGPLESQSDWLVKVKVEEDVALTPSATPRDADEMDWTAAKQEPGAQENSREISLTAVSQAPSPLHNLEKKETELGKQEHL